MSLARQALSKLLVPRLEQDLSKAVAAELSTVDSMVDCMMAPQVFAYTSTGSPRFGVVSPTAALNHPQANRPATIEAKRVVKISYPVTTKGLFQC